MSDSWPPRSETWPPAPSAGADAPPTPPVGTPIPTATAPAVDGAGLLPGVPVAPPVAPGAPPPSGVGVVPAPYAPAPYAPAPWAATATGGGGAGAWPPAGPDAVPYYGSPYVTPQPAAPTTRRRGALVAGAAALVALVSVAGGIGLGHAVWPGPSSVAAASASGSGSTGTGGSLGGNGTGTSTGAGAPSDTSTIAAEISPDLVDINTNLSYQGEEAAGTGIVLTSTGEILTNNHVIDGETSIQATDVGNGRTYRATVVGYDRTADVAVVQLIGASGLQVAPIASEPVSSGQAVVGVGNAGGAGGTPSAAGGSVVATGQSITASDDNGANAEHLHGMIETDAGIEPGDSGGALVDTSGHVLGMDTAASQGTGFQGTATQAYAIPIRTALAIARQIESGHGSSTVHVGGTAFLGVSVSDASTSPAGSFGLGGGLGTGQGGGTGSSTTTSGALISNLVTGGPADRAGLTVGDTITSLDGEPVADSAAVASILVPHHPGQTVAVQWTDSSGQTHSGSITLGSGPPA